MRASSLHRPVFAALLDSNTSCHDVELDLKMGLHDILIGGAGQMCGGRHSTCQRTSTEQSLPLPNEAAGPPVTDPPARATLSPARLSAEVE
jgi:hypothetical protein